MTPPSPFGQPAALPDFLDALLAGHVTPRTLRERNLIQLSLMSEVMTRFNLTALAAMSFIGSYYGARFPHPAS